MQRKEKDMYLPFWVCGAGIFFLAVCPVYLYWFLIETSAWQWLLGFVLFFVLGVSAVLCWRNQSARMISDSAFIYQTMFGRKHEYRFSDIRDLKHGRGSMTLILEHGKVYIDSCAIKSTRFINAINAALKKA
ncbi:MAG: hypothetical protein E7424_05710 [Ruminococcaceae bacterium]|nr:hypothetical protein [Oscillospiraceae bacterium]